MSDLIPVDEVLQRILSSVESVPETCKLSLDLLAGKVNASDVFSEINVPPADNSAMDGYALDANDPGIKAGGTYIVSDRVPAGSQGQSLAAGTLVRIFTGGEIPAGANSVVMQENTEPAVIEGRENKKSTGAVILHKKPELGQNVRTKGQDIKKGGLVLPAGKRLTAPDLGLLASIGSSEVEIFKPLSIGILSTGNELIEPPEPLQPGQIYNSNRFSLGALVTGLGMEPRYFGVVEDSAQATRDAFREAAEVCDILVSSGGVSVGEEDYVKQVVEELGKLDLWRIAIKPGKPLAFGSVLGKPFFGLPGNPVSAFVTFCLITRPFLLKSQGCSNCLPASYMAPVNFDFKGGLRVEYLRVRTTSTEGAGEVDLYSNQGSGVMSSLSWADALAEVPIGQQVKKGDQLKIYPLHNLST